MNTRRSLNLRTTESREEQIMGKHESTSFPKLYPSLKRETSRYTKISDDSQSESDLDDTKEETRDLSDVSTYFTNCSDPKDKKFYIFFGIPLLIICIAFIYLSISSTEIDETEKMHKNFIISVRHMLQLHYQKLDKNNRALLHLIADKAFLDGNSSPLVIAIGGNRANNFSEDLNSLLQQTQTGKKLSLTDEERLITIHEQTNRAELHETLRNVLGSQMSRKMMTRSSAVANIDLLKWDAVLVLHAFADHENFPIGKTVLFLTVSEEFTDHRNGLSCDDDMVRYLSKKWIDNGGSEDNIPPIVARIGYFICI